MENIIKTITTKKGARVSLVQPQGGRPFFRYEAGANAITDTFRYLIRQHGQEDTATVTVNVEVPVEEDTAQDYFNQQANGFIKCLEKFMDGSTATMALTNLLGIDEGQTLNDEWLEKVFSSFFFFDYANEPGNPFEFKEHIAKYVYRKEGYWEMMPGNDSISIQFPSSSASLDNDTVIEIRDYQYTEVKTDQGLNYFPTHIKAQLRVKEQPYFSVTLNGDQSDIDTEYHNGTGLPIAFDALLNVEPYNLALRLKNDSGKIFYPSLSLRDNDGCQLGMEAEIHLLKELSNDFSDEQIHVESASLYVNELTFKGLETLWLAAVTQADSQKAIDNIVKITCEYKGDTIGHVRFDLKEEAAILEYEDGTSQNLNELIMKFLDEYFNNQKPDGSARNKAFDMADGHYRGAGKQAATMSDSAGKARAKFSEGMRRRMSKSDLSPGKIADTITRFFSGERKEENDHSPYDHEEEMRRLEEEERKRREEEERRRREEEENAHGGKIDFGKLPGGIMPDFDHDQGIEIKPEAKPGLGKYPGLGAVGDFKPSPKPEPKPGAKTKFGVKPKPGAKTKPGAAGMQDIKPEAKPEPKPGAKTKFGVKPKPGAKTKPGAAGMQDIKPEAKPEPKPGAKTKFGVKPKPGAKTKPGAAGMQDIKPEAKPEPKPGAKTKIGVKTKPEAKASLGAKTKPGAKTKMGAKTKPGSKSKGS